jgi:hypothetical protein
MTSWSFATADCRRRRGEHNKPPSVDTRDTSAGSGPSGPLNNIWLKLLLKLLQKKDIFTHRFWRMAFQPFH